MSFGPLTAAELEERRLAELRTRMVNLRALREAAPPRSRPKRAHKRSRSDWTTDVRECIIQYCQSAGTAVFTLDDLSGYEDTLEELHEEARDIRAQIRHVLQLLRDKGEVFFVDNAGTYTYIPLESKAGLSPRSSIARLDRLPRLESPEKWGRGADGRQGILWGPRDGWGARGKRRS